MSFGRIVTTSRLAAYRVARRFRSLIPVAADFVPPDSATPGWTAILLTAVKLVHGKRFEEADRLLERGLAVYPDDPALLIEHAVSAHRRGLHHEAIARWRKARAAAPSEVNCHVNLAANLRESGECEAAGKIIAEALRRFPHDTRVLSEEARIAEAETRFADALTLWERLVRRPKPHQDWLRGHAHALVVLGRFQEAEDALARALARHPDSGLLLAVEGILASSREDWPKAIESWTSFRRRFPQDATGWVNYGGAVHGAMLAATDAKLAAAPPLTAPLQVDVVEDEDVRRLLLRFESIGDGCEFGLVQRRYAAEPLGLLRWNDVRLDNLLAALAQGFEGMGDPVNTEMPVIANGEYTIADKRWDLWMHTFLFKGQVDPVPLLPKMCRRVVYLRDKLLEELAAAEKIFVYCTAAIDTRQLAKLQAALDAYGPVKLLAVQPAGAASDMTGTAGEVTRIGERLWIGFLSRLGFAEGSFWDIAFEDWVSICRKVAVQSGLPAGAPSDHTFEGRRHADSEALRHHPQAKAKAVDDHERGLTTRV